MSRPLLILIEGRSGSGKTSLARDLTGRLRPALAASNHTATTIGEFALEDAYQGWNGLAAGINVFRDALANLAAGRTAHWPAWDWESDRPGPMRTTTSADIIIAEGVGASAALAPTSGQRTLLIRLEATPAFRKKRALTRDGDTFRPHWDTWAREEDIFFASPVQSTTATLTFHTDHPAWNSGEHAMESLGDTAFRAVMLWLSTKLPDLDAPRPEPLSPQRTVFATEADPVAIARIADRPHAHSPARSLMWLDSSNAHTPETRNRHSMFYVDSPGAQIVKFVRQSGQEWSQLSAPGVEYSIPIRAFDWLDAHWPPHGRNSDADGPDRGETKSIDTAAVEAGQFGWVGQFNYEVHSDAAAQPHAMEHLAPEHQSDHSIPTVIGRLLRTDRAILIDHTAHTTTFLTREGESTDWIAAYNTALKTLHSESPPGTHSSDTLSTGADSGGTGAAVGAGALRADKDTPPMHTQTTTEFGDAQTEASGVVVHHGEQKPPQFFALDTRESYLAKITAAQAQISEGNSYEVCLTTELRATATAEKPLELYARLRAANASAFGTYFRCHQWALLSTSPERFVQVSAGGLVRAEPIKGTRPRAADAVLDMQAVTELRASVKDRAENLMIVDLLRNDLSRQAVPGSVRVERLFAVESYPSVHQMVSTIVAQLPPGASRARAIEAAFPPGSMTGAPKAATMRILSGLERRERGPYSGFLGYFADDGSADLSVVIRTLVLDGELMTLAVGGAITADSNPAAEWDEVRAKAAGVLGVLGARFPD